MRNLLVMLVMVGMFQGNVVASPLSDFIIGMVFMGSGTYFEVERSGAKKDKEKAENQAASSFNLWQTQLVTANYYKGAADWEFINFGNTSAYRTLHGNFVSNFNSSQANLAAGANSVNSASDYQNKQNLYKGVSLTSFSVGSIFILKAGFTYAKERGLFNAPKSAKNFNIEPTADLHGAKIVWATRWGAKE